MIKPNTNQQVCDWEGCNREKFKEDDYCALHNKKGLYSEDFDKGLLSCFYDELISYILDYYFKYGSDTKNLIDFEVKEYLQRKGEDIDSFSLASCVRFTEIKFPARDSRDSFDYLSVLNKLKKVHFDRCHFMARSLDIQELEVFYQDCEFYNNWSLVNSRVLSNVNNVLYQNCTFHEDVSAFTPDNLSRYEFDVALFNDCTFKKSLELYNCLFKANIFNNTPNRPISINRIVISNSNVDSPFILNNAEISFFFLKDTVFKSKFEFKDGKVAEAEIDNSNFEKIFDSFNTRYGDFRCAKSIFSDFVGFERCVFSKPAEENIIKFQYATFLSFVSFRKAIFNSGLCLEEANFKELPNFLNIQIEKGSAGNIQTSRETFRIIKHSFDKTGNKIEGNKFFVYEMQKHLQELSNDKRENCAELTVLRINNWISRFGQSYVRPILLYITVALIYYGLTLGHKYNFMYRIAPSLNSQFAWISKHFNDFALILPLKSFLREGMEFLSLVFYIIFAVLTWQLVVSIKRHTTR